MASLFGSAAPQYVTPVGTALVTKTSGGLFGMFPGTPEYVRSELVPVANAVPMLASMASREVPAVEVQIRIPGLLNVLGTLSVPPWLPELAPVLVPALVNLARHLAQRDAACASSPTQVQAGKGGADAPLEPPKEPAANRSAIEEGVWARE